MFYFVTEKKDLISLLNYTITIFTLFNFLFLKQLVVAYNYILPTIAGSFLVSLQI